MMKNIELSYILSTYNKLPYLRETLDALIANKGENEEIVVVDGGSTDGTPEYLSILLKEGRIDQLLSEKDAGESHGFNKAINISMGVLIKIITDDDVFYYPHIKKCKAFMLEHPEIDFLNTNGAKKSRFLNTPLSTLAYTESFKKWLTTKVPFSSCGLGILIRKSSLPLLGYFDTNFIAMDAEYSYRVTKGEAKIAWFTGYVFVNISNPQSNSLTKRKEIFKEMRKLEKFYLGRAVNFSYFSRLKSLFRMFKNKILIEDSVPQKPASWKSLQNTSNDWLKKNSTNNTFEFLNN